MKKIALLAPRAGWSTEQFTTYWHETHGPIVSRSPGYDAFRRRYVQNHVLAAGPIGEPFRHGGVAEFWTPGGLEIEEAIAKSDIYVNRIGPDEARFLDLAGTVAVAAEETVIIPGLSDVKVMVFAARASGVSAPDYQRRRRELALDLVETRRDMLDLVRGYSQNHVLEGSLRSIADPTWSHASFDSVDEYWFDTTGDMHSFFTATYRESIAPTHDVIAKAGSVVSLCAEEIVFFDDGRVIDPPRRSKDIWLAKTR